MFPGSFVWGAGGGGKHLLLLHVIRQETKPSVYSHEPRSKKQTKEIQIRKSRKHKSKKIRNTNTTQQETKPSVYSHEPWSKKQTKEIQI